MNTIALSLPTQAITTPPAVPWAIRLLIAAMGLLLIAIPPLLWQGLNLAQPLNATRFCAWLLLALGSVGLIGVGALSLRAALDRAYLLRPL